MIPFRRPGTPIEWTRLKRRWDEERQRAPVTICIAAVCKHEGANAVVLCADYQGTRGEFIKADDTHKLWHFHVGSGAIAFAGDTDAGGEFFRRFHAEGVDLGAEFLVVFVGDEEPILFRIEQNGHVSIEGRNYIAIGSGEPLAAAVLSQVDQDTSQSLPECLTWVYQAKLAAENNPYVGKMTTFWVFSGNSEQAFLLTDEVWEILEQTSGLTLAPVSLDWRKLRCLFKKWQSD